jgi:hypothetical protein
MELLTGLSLGFAAGFWTCLAFIKRQMPDTPTQTPMAFPKPFGKKTKHTPKVNNDERAWKIENKREV